MPSVSKKQHNFMEAIAHSPSFAKKVGVPQKVGKDFATADKGKKFSELARLGILLNKTREEVARDNVTKAEVERITGHIDQRFNRLEEKIDQLIRQKG